jgi:hypothetical protein
MTDEVIAAPLRPIHRVHMVAEAFIHGTSIEYAITENPGHFSLFVWQHANYHMEARISMLEAMRGPLDVDGIVEQMKKEWKGSR